MRVSSFCGASLVTGCKIIAIMDLIFGGTSFATSITAKETLQGGDIPGNILEIVAAGLLLWGTLKNKSAPVLAYLIIEALVIFSDVVVFVVLAVSGALLAGGEPEQDVKGSALIGVAVFTAIAVLISIYLWIVVYSFYRQLKEGGSSSAPPIYKA